MRAICTLSGGKASAYCAAWTLSNFPKKDVVLYFNDTKWEHPDLYRFLNDLEKYFNHPITKDSDGRNPEQLFHDEHALANNRMPFCSRELKAVRLQKFYSDGDSIIFGIGMEEQERASRIVSVYQHIAVKTNKWPKLIFPLIYEKITKEQVDEFIKSTGIEIPLLYKLGFKHNNCSGGCVRAGKNHWKLLLQKLPDVYSERERMEREFREWSGKDVSIMKDMTLEELRIIVENQTVFDFQDDDKECECIGICGTMN